MFFCIIYVYIRKNIQFLLGKKVYIMASNCDNKMDCPCTYDCPRHGKCCACVAHHRDNNEGVPGCFFSKEAEATYDRSIEALARDHGIIE